MRPVRVSRRAVRTPALAAALATALALPLGWWVVADERAAAAPATVPTSDSAHVGGSSTSDRPLLARSSRSATRWSGTTREAVLVAADRRLEAGARLLALEHVACSDHDEAAAVAEAVALRADGSRAERALALRALRELAGSGRIAALERCAEKASDPQVRHAARLLSAVDEVRASR